MLKVRGRRGIGMQLVRRESDLSGADSGAAVAQELQRGGCSSSVCRAGTPHRGADLRRRSSASSRSANVTVPFSAATKRYRGDSGCGISRTARWSAGGRRRPRAGGPLPLRGTVEFVYDAQHQDFTFSRSTRVCRSSIASPNSGGVDLVEWMIRVAAVRIRADDAVLEEPRSRPIYAEDPAEISGLHAY